MTSNVVYKRQLCVIAFIVSFGCKICMLPRYMAETAGRQSWIAIALMMALEVVAFCFIYAVISKQSVLDFKMHSCVRYPLFILLFAVAMIKTVTVFAEELNYVSQSLFENGKWAVMLLAVMPVVMYLSYKGVHTIARTSLIVFWFIVFALAFTALLFNAANHFDNILPILPDGLSPVINAADKHLMWFADFTPLLFLALSKEDDQSKATVPVSIIILYIAVVLFYVVFISIYADASFIIDNAFAKIATFNYLSDVLGGVDFPIILCWIMMIIIKISMSLYVAVESAAVVVKKRPIAAAIVYLATYFILVFAVRNMENAYIMATSWARYVVAAVEFILPVILFVVMKVRNAKTSEK